MRAHARYPTTMPCSLELGDGRHVSGFVEDISMGGVGVRVNEELTGIDEFTLVLTHGGEPLHIACNVRHTRELWETRFLHARFRRLSAPQHQAVERIVGSLARASNDSPEPRDAMLRRLIPWLPRRG